MLKLIKTGLIVAMVLAFFASCQNSGNDVKEAARQKIEQNNSVQPNNPVAQTAAQTQVPSGPTTGINFDETEFDFGVITEGEKVSHTYTLTNTGKEPLIISNARATCGCTVPKWPREPVAPGETAVMTVEFNSKNKRGKKNQKVTITANTNPPQTFIYLKGEVLPAETEGADIKVTQ